MTRFVAEEAAGRGARERSAPFRAAAFGAGAGAGAGAVVVAAVARVRARFVVVVGAVGAVGVEVV